MGAWSWLDCSPCGVARDRPHVYDLVERSATNAFASLDNLRGSKPKKHSYEQRLRMPNACIRMFA
jgi:hypothetical protein